MMKNHYNIAVVGESMSGKSTLISNLFTEEISQKLLEMCRKNEKGQTKLPVWYTLTVAGQPLKLDKVEWDCEALAGFLQGKGQDPELLRTVGRFGFLENCPALSDEELKNYQDSSKYTEQLSSMEDFILEELINDRKLCEANLVRSVEFSGSAGQMVRDIMESKGLERLTLRDTRGFLDETEEKIAERFAKDKVQEEGKFGREMTEQEKLKRDIYWQLGERGLVGQVDACIFLSLPNANTLNKEMNRKLYGGMLGVLLTSCPTALVIRHNDLTRKMLEMGEAGSTMDALGDYQKALSFVCADDTFSGFDTPDELLDEYMDGGEGYLKELIRENRGNYILPDISRKLKESRVEDARRIQCQSAAGVLACLLGDMENYFASVKVAEDCEKEMGSCTGEEFQRIFYSIFQKNIALCNGKYVIWKYLDYYPTYVAARIREPYVGGWVGPRGGLTTRLPGGGRVGDLAINVLKGSYWMRKDIFDTFVQEKEPKVQEILRGRISDPDALQKAVKEMTLGIRRLYADRLWKVNDILSGGPMVNRRYLEWAYGSVNTKRMEEGFKKWLADMAEQAVVKQHMDVWEKECVSVFVTGMLLYYTASCAGSRGE